MILKIVPYKSVGNICFGMTKSDVIEILGNPISELKNYFGDLSFFYENLNFAFSKSDGKLIHVGFCENAGVDLLVSEVNIFKDIKSFEKLISMDGKAYEHLGVIVLLNIGITLTGFHDSDGSEEKTVTVFAEGRNGDVMKNGKPYVIRNYSI